MWLPPAETARQRLPGCDSCRHHTESCRSKLWRGDFRPRGWSKWRVAKNGMDLWFCMGNFCWNQNEGDVFFLGEMCIVKPRKWCWTSQFVIIAKDFFQKHRCVRYHFDAMPCHGSAVGFQAFDTLRRELMASAYQFPINRSAFGWFGMEFFKQYNFGLGFWGCMELFSSFNELLFSKRTGVLRFNDFLNIIPGVANFFSYLYHLSIAEGCCCFVFWTMA